MFSIVRFKRKKLTLTLALLSVFFSSSLLASNAIIVTYDEPDASIDDSVIKLLQSVDGVPFATSLLNDILDLPQPITVRYGANEGPLYDPQINEIWIPYAFVTEITNRFSSSGLSSDDEHATQITLDVLMHTLFHEVGHALVALYELPILGREEDAVDGLANVLMLEYLQEGADATLNAADMFSLESEDREYFDEQDFWDSHSLDIQRYYTTVCHVYGNAPELHEDLRDELLSEERGEECVEEYEQLSYSWMRVLAPYLAKPE
jgi:hypothetical protein